MYFVYNASNRIVYAVLQKYDRTESKLSQLPAGKHLLSIKATQRVDVVPAEHLIDTLVYININCSSLPEESQVYVAAMPSCHRHAIFK